MKTPLRRSSSFGPVNPATQVGYADPPPRKGFFTDTSICIGCKACEVACKEWNGVPDDGFNLLGMSYDNTGSLNANTWRHVAFIEQSKPLGAQAARLRETVDLPMPGVRPDAYDGPITRAAISHGAAVEPVDRATSDGRTVEPAVELVDAPVGEPVVELVDAPVGEPVVELVETAGDKPDFRWLMASDVCKHCTHAACLDVCPTGSLFRTEFGTVVVQDDICNGCGYCVPACPYGVIERRTAPEGAKNVGIAQKCTLCYDRLGAGQHPACAQACPTESIQFGDVDELRERAAARVEALHEAGIMDARLYGEDPNDGVGGAGAFFLLLDEPETYGFPPDPVVTTQDLPRMYGRAAAAAVALLAGAAISFVGRRR